MQVLISDYENDKLRPNPDVLVRFAVALDVSTDDPRCCQAGQARPRPLRRQPPPPPPPSTVRQAPQARPRCPTAHHRRLPLSRRRRLMDLRQTIELAAGRAPWRTAEESMQGAGLQAPLPVCSGRTARWR
ncbi:MAG: helix-turn-helix transcriptional regulator [Polyangiaceae bacterium]|nr:helix-turn-helix transcriptional regulator [Polyangiaceae bacterium]